MEVVDARGLHCPEPTMMARARLRGLNNGGEIKVLVTYPRCAFDLRRFCLFMDHTWVSTEEKDGYYEVRIRKGLKI